MRAPRPLFLIFVALFNSILGLSILFPILGPLGRELHLSELQVGSLSTSYALMQFLTSAYWGRRSEADGRKPIILRGILGFFVSFLCFAVVADLGLSGVLDPVVLYPALLSTRILGGIYSSATLPTAQAYVADVTQREQRTSGMAVVGAAFGLALIFGPALGALLAPIGLLVPVYLSSGIALLNAVFVALFVPEPTRHRPRDEKARLGPVVVKVRALLLIGLTATLAAVSMEQTVAFYFQDRLSLDTTGAARSVGLSLVAYGVVAVVIQGFIVRRVRWRAESLIRLGVPIAAVGLLALSFARTEPLLIASMALQGAGQGLTLPGVSAALSLRVGDGEQGAVAGLNSSSQALGRTVGPVLGTGLYELRPSYPYLFGAGLLLLMFVVFAVGAVRRSEPAG